MEDQQHYLETLDDLTREVRYSKDIFGYLKSGRFLCSANPDDRQKRWFNELEKKYDVYSKLYQLTMGITLVRKPGYYFFGSDDGFNRDEKVKRIVDKAKSYLFCMDVLQNIELEIEPGNDKLRTSLVQRVFESKPAMLPDCKMIFRDKKAKKGEEPRFYADETIKLMETDLNFIARSERETGTVFIILESINYYKELINAIRENTFHDYEQEILDELSDNGADLFDKEEDTETKNQKE